MSNISSDRLLDVAADIDAELARLTRLVADADLVRQELESGREHAQWLHESLAFKLHNFYTSCERIFQIIATELNGGLPTGNDWHSRLLDRMNQRRNYRIAVVSGETAKRLQPYLGFRHVVRNIYGFELDADRLLRLVTDLPATHTAFQRDASEFVGWLRELAA